LIQLQNNSVKEGLLSFGKYPGTGAILESIQLSLNNEEGGQQTKRPEIVGKGNPFVIDLIT